MFCGIIYIILMLLGTIVSEYIHFPFYGDELHRQHTFHDILDSRTQNEYKPTEEFLVHSENRKGRKREIVLIDEDFDKLPEHHFWQGKGDTNTEPTETESDKYQETEEGSGSTFVDEDSTTKHISTPEKLLTIKDKQDTTAEHTSETEHLHSKLDITVKHTSTAERLSSDKTKTLTDSTIEGSGDDVDTTTTTKKEEVTDVIEDSKVTSCMNYTCDAQDIEISPGFTESLPEDMTLILSCSMKNRSKSDVLQWYKTKGSDNSLLQTSLTGNTTQFTVPKAKTQDSGIYVCLRWSKYLCCHKQLEVIIYKKPNYKYHLLIVGLVAAVSLFICLLLTIHRSYKNKQFKKQLNNQIPLNEFLL